MGDIAEMMLDGTLCEQCGVLLDDEGGDYPRSCPDCARDFAKEQAAKPRVLASQPLPRKLTCPDCGRSCGGDEGLRAHRAAKHGGAR